MPNASAISKVQSPEAAARLAELEGKISQARKGGIEIGRALREIRDDSLFGEHGSFEAYVKGRGGYQRAYAFRLIQAAALVDEVLEQLLSTRVDVAEKLADWGNIRRATAEIMGRVNVDRSDERTERFEKAIGKLEAVIRHVRDRDTPIDRTAMASYLGDILRLVQERKTGRKNLKKEGC